MLFRSPALKAKLFSAGFLVSNSTDELQAAVTKCFSDQFDIRYTALTISPTLYCNLRCTYCYAKDHPPVHMTRLTERDICQIASKLISRCNYLHVAWAGGEPLARTETIVRLSTALKRLCATRGVRFDSSLITNGVFLTEKNAQRLNTCNIHMVRITVDGLAPIHNKMRPGLDGAPNFDQVIEGIQVALKFFPFVALSINIDRRNTTFIGELLKELVDRRLTRCRLLLNRVTAHCQQASYLPEDYLSVPEFAREESRLLLLADSLGFSLANIDLSEIEPVNICGALAGYHYALEPEGRMTRCWCEIGDANAGFNFNEGEKVKNIASAGVTTDPNFLDDECRQCRYLPICYGGCPKDRSYPPVLDASSKLHHRCTPRRFNLGNLLELDLVRGLDVA